MLLIRRIGALALVAAALAVWFTMTPEEPSTLNHGSSVAAIEDTDDENNGLTSGAPQQTVVNGWTANEYLKLISTQLDANGSVQPVRDMRPTALLVLGVSGIALIAFTTPRPPVPASNGPAVGPAVGPGANTVADPPRPVASPAAAPSNGHGATPTILRDTQPPTPLGKHV